MRSGTNKPLSTAARIEIKELLARTIAPTAWKIGDRVQTRRNGIGEVMHVENATGAADGIQMIGVALENGTILASLGGELEPLPEPIQHTERCHLLDKTAAGHRMCGCRCHA